MRNGLATISKAIGGSQVRKQAGFALTFSSVLMLTVSLAPLWVVFLDIILA